MTSSQLPEGRSARYVVLCAGYVHDRVASTVSYVEDGEFRAVIDPGMVASRDNILRPLVRRGVRPEAITDVVISHHHPDHTLNCALFPRARVHDFWAVYEGDRWTARPAEGLRLAPSVLLWQTPGHTPQDITTLVGTRQGIAAFTHLWWHRNGPTPDPLATNPRLLERQRQRVLRVARTIVPGHGGPFAVPRRATA
jgi:glyoxylase-like metal-dependent hydrolase (beta-lactamase superfamily II)